MKIYTKRGDAGETGLVGGGRVSKDDRRIQTYGTIDELNAVLGVVLSEADFQAVGRTLFSQLLRIQSELFQLGAELATPAGKAAGLALLGEAQISALELEIDAMEASLPPLKNFILPGGSRLSSLLHLSRTTSRRAERELIALHRAEPQRPEVLQYVNRLSDYLFVCARYANHLFQVTDIPWVAPPVPGKPA